MFIVPMALFALVPFVIIHCMPGKKSFAVTAIIFIGLLIFLHFDAKNADGPGAFLGLIFYYLMIYGTIAGLLTKAITLLMARKGVSSKKRFLVRVLGVALIPCFVYLPQLYNEWNHRAPTDDCNYDMITFSINGHLFQLPSLNIVTANSGNGRSYGGDLSDFFAFHGNKSYRKFCDAFDNGHEPASVNAITISFERLARAKAANKQFVSLCKQANWPDAICEYSAPPYKVPDGYPSEISIYHKNNFFAGFFGGGWDAARVNEKMEAAITPSDIEGFRFDGHYYYSLSNVNNIVLALKCFKSANGLYCSSDESYTGDVFIHWAGIVNESTPLASAMVLREKAKQFIDNLHNTNKDSSR